MPVFLYKIIDYAWFYDTNYADKKGNDMMCIKKQIDKSIDKINLLNALNKLFSDLEKLGAVPNGVEIYDYAVKFFNITTSFQDKHPINPKLINDTQVDAQRIIDYIYFTGRGTSDNIQNQTKVGDIITLDNLFIGVPTERIVFRSAAFFKTCTDTEVQPIVSKTLFDFINTYRHLMIESLSRIVRFNKKPNNFIIRRIYEKRNQITK